MKMHRNFSLSFATGIIAATNEADRLFDPLVPGARIQVFIRAKNYQIKEAPLIDCKFMDYLLDGNRFLENGSFTSSSVITRKSDVIGRDFKFLNAHNSFLSEPYGGGGWVPSPGDSNSWISVDLITPHKLTAVITRGAQIHLDITDRGTKADTWISGFKLETGGDTAEAREGTLTKVIGNNLFMTIQGANNITMTRLAAIDDVRFVKLQPSVAENGTFPVENAISMDDTKKHTFGLRWELAGEHHFVFSLVFFLRILMLQSSKRQSSHSNRIQLFKKRMYLSFWQVFGAYFLERALVTCKNHQCRASKYPFDQYHHNRK